MKSKHVVSLAAAVVFACAAVASASSMTFYLSDPGLPGLSAEAQFTIIDPITLEVRLKNTSTAVPTGFETADQLITAVSWDFGIPGWDSDPSITGGMVVIGPDSQSVNFDTGWYGPGTDVSGEYGYGNMDGTGLLANFITCNVAEATPFGGPNLDGPVNIDGPQAGLVADPIIVPLGGLGAIQDEIIATLTLSAPIYDLNFLTENLVRIEFGSDAAYITVPEPGTVLLILAGGIGAATVRRWRRKA